MKIIKIGSSLLLLRINKNNVKCLYLYPISLFNWIASKNTIDLTNLTVRLVVQVYEDLKKDYDKKYKI